jgi:hypothetical protein
VRGIIAVSLLLLSLVLLVGCNSDSSANQTQSPPKPKNTKIESALESEQDDVDSAEIRMLIRQKTTEYLKSVKPDYQVKGISVTAFRGNIYAVGIDALSGRDRKTFDLIARLYIADDGESYWKIENLTQRRSDMLSGRTLDSADTNDDEPPDEP